MRQDMTIQDVIDEMLSTPYARTYKDDYIYVRCPICGDSQKHLDGSHCSIWIRPGLPLVYHCWICESSGLVDKDFLRDLNISDPNIITAAVRYNRETMKNKDVNDKFVSPINAKNILIPQIEENKITRPKIEYMRERLGVDFTVKSLEYLRCVTSIYDFLALNHLNPTAKFVDTVKFLEKYAIGFLSTDRTYIVFRNVDKKMKFRYMKYPIFDGLNIGNTSYTIPSQVDIMEPSVDLHIAEGTFDILSVFFKSSTDFISVSINSSLAFAISSYFVLLSIFYHISPLSGMIYKLFTFSNILFVVFCNNSAVCFWVKCEYRFTICIVLCPVTCAISKRLPPFIAI